MVISEETGGKLLGENWSQIHTELLINGLMQLSPHYLEQAVDLAGVIGENDFDFIGVFVRR